MNRNKIESILSVPGIQGCHKNALYKSMSGTILAERMLPNLDEKYQDGNRPMVMVQKEGSILNAPEFLSFLESLRFFQDVGIVPNRVPWILAEFDTSMILFLLSIVMMRYQKICSL